LHGVQSAILDALQKKASLKGATVYSTLIPDNKDSQMIREVGIARVVYEQDKFPYYAFTIASKKILEGLDWR
jgi:deoxycytidylate deaminase